MSAPQPTTTTTPNKHTDTDDVQYWKQRFSKAFHEKAWKNATPHATRQHENSLFGCFSPFSLCITTCCLPCITFGKTDYRIRRNGNMDGYEPINPSCLAFWASTGCAAAWILQALQMQDMREKYDLQGSCMGDIAKSCCCGCCAIIQAEKESQLREKERGGMAEQYRGEQMRMAPGV